MTRENIRRSSANIPTAGRLRQQSLDRRWRARFSLPSCNSFSTTALDRSIVPFFSFRLFARRGEGRGGDAKRGEATRSGGYSTRRGAPLSTALIRIRAPLRRAFSRKSIRRVRFSDFDGRCSRRNARKSWNVALGRNATITDGSFCFLFSSKSS